MKIMEAADYTSMSRKAANILSAQVILFPRSVLGLATGSTPLGIYRQLVEWYDKGDIDGTGKASCLRMPKYICIIRHRTLQQKLKAVVRNLTVRYYTGAHRETAWLVPLQRERIII